MSAEVDHFKRDLAIILLCLGSVISVVVIGLHIFLVDPVQQQIKKLQENFTAEQKHVELMSCQELKNGLLHNTIQWSSNIQRASERYIGGCE